MNQVSCRTLGFSLASSSSALAAFFFGGCWTVVAFSAFLASFSRFFWRFFTGIGQYELFLKRGDKTPYIRSWTRARQ